MSVISDGAQGATEAKAAHLGRRSLGVADIVFFVVAASAPLTVVAGGVPTSFAVTELLGIPLVFGAAVVGLVYGLVLKRSRPDVYALVARGGDSA